MLEEMDQKNQKKYKEVAETNEVMEQAIDLKKKKKEEELYQKKTLQKQIEKLKTDILLIQKEIITKEIQYKRLEKQYELERINENEIRLKKNNKYMQIETQKDKNKYEQEIAKYLINAPTSITAPERTAVKRTPILSRMIPAKIRKKTKTLRNVSEPCIVPNAVESHPRSDIIKSLIGERMSIKIYEQNIASASNSNAVQRIAGLSLKT